MLISYLASFVVVLATAALAEPAVAPPSVVYPATEYLFSVNIISGAPIILGATPAGQRNFAPIAGGNFSGPGLQGKVVGGLDYGLVDNNGSFNPDVVYLLQTSDGCNIMVRERGHVPNIFLLFETPCSKYNWLNVAIAYGKAAQVAGGVSVDVFRIGLYQN